jgi:hypothetical protein
MVVLNFVILAVLICFLVSTALIPPSVRDTNWEQTIHAVAAAILPVAPAMLRVQQVQRASIRGQPCSCPELSSRTCMSPWMISQMSRSHPWTVRRIWRLYQLGLFGLET